MNDIKKAVQESPVYTSPSELSVAFPQKDEKLNELTEPLLFDEGERPEILCSLLPEWLGEFAEAVSRATQTPPALSVMTALGIISTCVQGGAVVSPHNGDDYCEPLNTYSMIALPSGSRKTAVVKAFTAPLVEWERLKHVELSPKIEEHATLTSLIGERIKALEKNASKCDDRNELLDIAAKINKLKGTIANAPIPPRYWTGDVTPERLQGLMVEHDGRMAILADEGGVFDVVSGDNYGGKGVSNVDILMHGYNNTPVRVDRGGRTANIAKPALTICISFQPSVLTDLGTGGKKRFRGNGLLARFAIIVPKSNIGQRDARRREPVPEETRLRYETCIQYLLRKREALSNMVLTLSSEARELYLCFAEEIEKRLGSDLSLLQDWGSKLPGHMLRIAGLMHAVVSDLEPDATEIQADTVRRAIELCRLWIPHAVYAFGILGTEDRSISDARFLVPFLRETNLPTIKRRQLQELSRFKNDPVDRLNAAIKVLQDRHIIGVAVKSGATKPAISYNVNPAIFAPGGKVV